VAVFAWALIPTSNEICQAQACLLCLGYILVLGAMFSKCWEVSKIFYRAENGNISPFVETSWWKFCLVLIRVVLIEVLMLAVWMGTIPPTAHIAIIDPINLIGRHSCRYNPYSAFFFVYFVLILGWGAYLAYITRDIWVKHNYPNESKAILMSIYNLAFCGFILLPLALLLNVTQDVIFFLMAVFLMIPTTFALVTVYGPKLLDFLSASKKDKNSKGATISSFPTGKIISKAIGNDKKDKEPQHRDPEDDRNFPSEPLTPEPNETFTASNCLDESEAMEPKNEGVSFKSKSGRGEYLEMIPIHTLEEEQPPISYTPTTEIHTSSPESSPPSHTSSDTPSRTFRNVRPSGSGESTPSFPFRALPTLPEIVGGTPIEEEEKETEELEVQ